MRMIGERVSYVERVPTCFIACWAEIGRVFGINSPSMAGLFDVGVICGNMAANRRYRMTSRRKKKFGTKARGVGFYPSVLRRSATEETVGKSNLGFAPSLRVLCPVSAATVTRSKAGFNYFSRNKKKRSGIRFRLRRLNFNASHRQESPQTSDSNSRSRYNTLLLIDTKTATCGFNRKILEKKRSLLSLYTIRL